MVIKRENTRSRSVFGLLLCFFPVFILMLTSIHSGFASDITIVDNGDYTFTATWDFNDMTNYTLTNTTASNGEINITMQSHYWNQSGEKDFAEGQGSNVVVGDGIVTSMDDLVLGYLVDQSFTRPDTWNYTNGTNSKVISEWLPAEKGWIYSIHPQNITIKNSTFQPDSLTGIDTYINELSQLTNYGGVNNIRVQGVNERRGILWFDMSSLADTKVIDAKLELYFYTSADASSLDISAHRITSSWAEMSVNWQMRDILNAWSSLGGDFDATALDTVSGLTNNYGWKSWNITSLVDGWVNGTYQNYGVLIYSPTALNTWKDFYSSDYTGVSLRPKLNITYYPLNTYYETGLISENFQILDPGAYRDYLVTDFEQGQCYNTTITPANYGEIVLGSLGYLKFETMDDITDWQEDTSTTKNAGTFQLSTTIFIEGTGSMQVDYKFANMKQNYGVMKNAATFWDWSRFTDMVIWATSDGQGEVMKVILEDTWGTSWESSPQPLLGSWYNYMIDLTDFTGDISSVDTIRIHFSDTTEPTTTYLDNITLIGGAPYFPDGDFTSQVIDGGYEIQWETILWDEDRPASTDIWVRTRTGNTSIPDASWSVWSSSVTDPDGSTITNPEGRYIQYRIFFTTSDPDYSPTVSEVILIKSEYNLTINYTIDAFENIVWSRVFLRLNGDIIWQKIISSTSATTNIAFDVGKFLYEVGENLIEFGLTVNSDLTQDVNISATIDDFQVKGFNGLYISKVYNTGSQAFWENITWNADFPSGTNITLNTRSSWDNITWSPWSGPLAYDQDIIANPSGKYIQYRTILKTQILGITPVLKDVNITFNRYAFLGTVTFLNDLVVENITRWSDLSYNATLRGQSISFEYSIDSGANWYSVPGDGNLSMVITSTNKIRFKAILEAQNTSLSPTLLSVHLKYHVNHPPAILGIVPDQTQAEDAGSWTLDLTPYESDYEDTNDKLRWYITDDNSSLYTISGELSGDDVITFTPQPDAYGNDQIVLWLEDSYGIKTSQTLWINITPVNDPPEILGVIPSFDKRENDPNWQLDLSGYKFDKDNSPLDLAWSASGWDPSLFTSVSIAGNIITFDLAPDSFGNDEITLVLTDTMYIDTQVIWVNVSYINKPPQINGIIPNFDKTEDDLPWVLDLTSFEMDREDPYPSTSLTWSVLGVDSSLFSLSISDNNITFNLVPNAYGNDEITIVLTDGDGAIDQQKIWVNVTSANDAPVIKGVIPSFEKTEDAINWNIDLSSYKYDVDNLSSELTWQISGWDPGLFTSVNLIGNVITFQLLPDAYGSNKITIMLSDGILNDTQEIWVNVTSINDAPEITSNLPDFLKNEDDVPWTLDLTSYESDVEDGSPSPNLIWGVVDVNLSLHTVTIDDNNITFTLKPDAWGNDEVTIILIDSNGATDSQKIWINVTPSNDAPRIVGMIPSFDKNEDATNWNFGLSGYKFDIDNSSMELSWQILGWDFSLFDSVSVIGDVVTFDLKTDAYGNDEITIVLTDGLLTDSQTFWVNVTSVNDAPQIMSAIPDFDRDEDDLAWTIDLTSYESDVEDGYPSPSLTWSVSDIDFNLISVTIFDNNLTFTLKPDAYGNDEIMIILTDGNGAIDSQKIWINVTPRNDAPRIVGMIPSFEKNEDATNWNFGLSGYKFDVDNSSMELSWQILGWNVSLFDTVSVIGDVVTFDLKTNAYGNDEMMIVLSDGLLTDSQTFWVNITSVNDPPQIIGVIPDIDKDEDDPIWTLDLTSYESDLEDGYPSPNLIWSVSQVDFNLISITISDNNITFTLKPDAYGNDEITIVLTDSNGGTDTQNIWVNVAPINDPPKIHGVIPSFDKEEDDNNWNINLSPYKSDVDNPLLDLYWSITGWSSQLFDTVTLAGDILTFDLALNAYGNDLITITLSDGILGGSPDTQDIWVNVTPINDAPQIVGIIPNILKQEDNPSWTVDLTNYESDVEDKAPSSSLTWSVEGIDTSLFSVSISDNNLTFTLVSDAFGKNYITITLTDSNGGTDFQGVLVEISPVNDAPSIQSSLPNIVLNEDSSTSISLLSYGSDKEDTPEQLRWSLTNTNKSLYSWQIDPATNMLYIDPLPNAFGINTATLTLMDSEGATTTRNLQVIVLSRNDAPYIYPQIPQSLFDILEDEPISIILTGFEHDVEDPNELLMWEVQGVDTSIIKVSINSENDELVIVPVISFLPGDTETVETQITLVLRDSDGGKAQQNITVTIIPVNNEPVIDELPNLIIKYEDPYIFDLSPYVFDEDTRKEDLIVTTSEPTQDSGKGYIAVNGLNLTFLYPKDREGDIFSVLITLSDGQLSSYTIMQVEISNHRPPELSSPLPNIYFDEDSEVKWAFDLDDYFVGYEEDPLNYTYYLEYTHHGDNYVFVIINKNNTVSFSAAENWYGIEQISFRAEDTYGAIAEGTIQITVNPVNDPPTIMEVPDQECKVNVTKVLNLAPFLGDVDTPSSALMIATDSDYITIQGHTLKLYYDEITMETVNIIVSDGFSQTGITIEVEALANQLPIISLLPELKVKGGEVYFFSLLPYIKDNDNDIEELEIWTDSPYINVNPEDNMLLQIDYPADMVGNNIFVTLFVSDGLDMNSTQVFIQITNELIPKLISNIPNLFFAEDTIFSNELNLNDYFENVFSYQYFGNENINITIENGWLTLTAPENWSGSEMITFRGISDDAFVEDTIEVTVKSVNDPPILHPLPRFDKKVNEIWVLNLIDYIEDIDNSINDIIVSVDSPHVIMYALNVYFQYPFEIYDEIVITINDGKDSTSGILIVNVTAENNAPIYKGLLNKYHFKPGDSWSIYLDDYFYDVDGDFLSFSCNKEDIVIDPITHKATWTPKEGEQKLEGVIFSADDGYTTIESSPIAIIMDVEKSEPSFWEQNWWLILLIALLTSALIVFAMTRRREEEEEEIEYSIPVDNAVEYLASEGGGNYLIKSETSETAYKTFSGLLKTGFEGLCITTKPPDELTKRYELGKAWIIKLALKGQKSSSGGEDEKVMGMLALGDEERGDEQYMFSSNFKRIVETIEDFITGGDHKVVLLDGLEYILGGEELIMYIGFIASLRERLKDRKSCLLIPIDPKTLSDKELRLLERETINLGKALRDSAKKKPEGFGLLASKTTEDTAEVPEEAEITEETDLVERERELPPPPPRT